MIHKDVPSIVKKGFDSFFFLCWDTLETRMVGTCFWLESEKNQSDNTFSEGLLPTDSSCREVDWGAYEKGIWAKLLSMIVPRRYDLEEMEARSNIARNETFLYLV